MRVAGTKRRRKDDIASHYRGITRADSGIVRIDGTDITTLSEAGRDRFRASKVGYVFQTFNLLPALRR